MPSSLEDYEVIGPIGTGSYGSCSKIRRIRDKKLLVWKVLDYLAMSDSEKQMLVAEVNLLRDLRHEHIVRYYDRIIDRRSSRLYIVMELCAGGDLAELIAKTKREGSHIEEDFVWQVCWQIASALNECHGRHEKGKSSVMHRDLKPANVFLDARRNVKLGDFGLARVLQHDTSFARTFVGTPYYMSPELMNGHQYNEKSDVWSLGCLLYELCALVPPFTGSSHPELANKICLGRYQPISPALYSTDLKDLIGLLLQVESSKRPSIKSLLENSMLQRHFTAVCITCGRKSAAISDSSSDAAKDSLLRKRLEVIEVTERELRKREEVLERGEKENKKQRCELEFRFLEIERRERDVTSREQQANQLMAKAERLKFEYTMARHPVSGGSPDKHLNNYKTSSDDGSSTDLWHCDDLSDASWSSSSSLHESSQKTSSLSVNTTDMLTNADNTQNIASVLPAFKSLQVPATKSPLVKSQQVDGTLTPSSNYKNISALLLTKLSSSALEDSSSRLHSASVPIPLSSQSLERFELEVLQQIASSALASNQTSTRSEEEPDSIRWERLTRMIDIHRKLTEAHRAVTQRKTVARNNSR